MKTKKRGIKTNYGTISLPLPLIEKIKKKMRGTGMQSVSAYVAFVLRQILSESENKNGILSRKDEQKIRARLKNLGYL